MNNPSLPLLYTFRRCPYAIRASMAIFYAGIPVELHEVSLKNKPRSMLEVSANGTVPVLCVGDRVIEESLDVMLWALERNDPDGWYATLTDSEKNTAMQLIEENDNDFKPWLDKYKYADRYPEHSADYYRQKAEVFLKRLEQRLLLQPCLFGAKPSLADMAIFPFIRQFSMVDKHWFEQCEYQQVRNWLNALLALPLFSKVMAKQESTPVIGTGHKN
jgi:glutathione S-transferase